MSAAFIIVSYVCPLLGALLANFMWVSPFTAICRSRRQHSLGTLNPFPFGITVFNCIAWVGYSILTEDYWLFFANFPGLVLGLFYSISALAILYSPHINERGKGVYQVLENILIGSAAFYCLEFCLVGFVFPQQGVSSTVGEHLVGYTGVLAALCYYGAPLSTMKIILQTKDSSTLHIPMIIANMCNALMWMVYGAIALNDPIVYAPNALGFLLGAAQLSLSWYYPRTQTRGIYSTKLGGAGRAPSLSSASSDSILGGIRSTAKEYWAWAYVRADGEGEQEELEEKDALFYASQHPRVFPSPNLSGRGFESSKSSEGLELLEESQKRGSESVPL